MPWTLLLPIVGLAAAALCVEVARGATTISAILWRPVILRYRRVDQSSDWPENAILLYGSSTFWFWNTATEDLEPWPVVNRGFGGSRVSDLYRYARGMLAGGVPRAVVLYVANDVTGRPWDFPIPRAAAIFEKLLRVVRRTYPDTPVIWLEVNPTPRRWNVWPRLQTLNDAYRESCRRVDGVVAARCWDALMTDGVPEERFFRSDRLHLNDDGYAVFAAALQDVLEVHLGPPDP